MVEINPYAPPQFPAGKGLPRLRIRRRIRAWLIAISLCYAVSLPLPATYGSHGDAWLGITCLVFLPWELMFPAWYANVFLVAGMFGLAAGKHMETLVLGLLATAAALSFLLMNGLETWRSLGIAYYLWLTCMVLLVVAALDGLRQSWLNAHSSPVYRLRR